MGRTTTDSSVIFYGSNESTQAYALVDRGKEWQPGVLKRVPWLAWLAIVGSVGAIIAATAVVFLASHSPVDSWPVQPAVYLAIATAAANIMLRYAMSEGVAIVWWTRALTGDTTLQNLHNNWEFGNSLWAVLRSGRNFNLIALAALLVTIVPINGPFLQQATRVEFETSYAGTSLVVTAAQTIPDGYTGWISGRGHGVALLTEYFVPTVNQFYNGSDIKVTNTGCNGICTGTLEAAGWDISCSSNAAPFSIDETIGADATQIFGSQFNWYAGTPGVLNISVQFKPEMGCSGTLTIRNCTLKPAVVQYPIVIDSNRSTIALDPESSVFDDRVVNNTIVVNDVLLSSGPTTLGGMYIALNNRYSSTANMHFEGAVGYELDTTGAVAHQFAQYEADIATDCSISYGDPLQDLMSAARELMFRTALNPSANGTAQMFEAVEQRRTAVYRSNSAYVAAGVAVTCLCLIFLLPLFNQYWTLGRSVSMSPLEVASAFGSPLPGLEAVNQSADDIVAKSGHLSAQYGSVGQRLVVSETSAVSRPRTGERFQ